MKNKAVEKAIRDLDEWAKGFLVGIATGAALTFGTFWAIAEKMK